jgi:hypothetical protein
LNGYPSAILGDGYPDFGYGLDIQPTSTYKRYSDQSHRNWDRLKKKHHVWLESEFKKLSENFGTNNLIEINIS